MKNDLLRTPILLIDDEEAILEVMSVNLEKKNHIIETAKTGQEAISKVSEKDYSTIILDYALPDMNGLDVLSAIKKKRPNVPIIMITAYGTIEMAVSAMKAGVFNYLVKPINYEEMELIVDKAVEHYRLIVEVGTLRKQLDDSFGLDNIIGKGTEMQKVFEKVKMVAETDATVLIRGETGTGKELIARAVHSKSLRSRNSFIRINCAAVPATLLEAELFGHEKGAFTGAIKQKPGKFELANKGTILLDEIGDVSMEMQTKLLRVLQDGEFDRVGGTTTLVTDARVIATTNKNLEEAIKEEKFRLDLFYRLNVIPINVPPLRERKEDIPLLISHFIHKYCGKNNMAIKEVPPALAASLIQYSWPGNVRELENVIERAVVLSRGKQLENVEIVETTAKKNGAGNLNLNETNFQTAKKKIIESFEEQYLDSMLKKHKGNISASARESGLDYKNFHTKLKKYNIRKREFEDN
ncbi:MAG: sigma-54 dependent transcriptional regulator [Nitrospinota bacterium]|nr:sigma-54 dependent transcriptional regulator [Nitrospinota bacterium]